MTSIDLRSDLCSVPTGEMWEAMRAAELGWPRFREDAAVNELCRRGAELLGKEAAIWIPTCGVGNLAALLTFCAEGDRVVLEAASHVLTSESSGISQIARLEPAPLWAPEGRLEPASVASHLEETGATLLVLENTHTRAGGTTLSVGQTQQLAKAAKRNGARVHLDGARLVNAAIALGVPLADLARPADSVVFALNKGLSAPFGALLASTSDSIRELEAVVHRLGAGTVHRAGIAAAAGLVALDTMVDRIADDHRRAQRLGALLAEIPGLRLRPEKVETNIVMVDCGDTGLEPAALVRLLDEQGVRTLSLDSARVRFTTHRLITDADIEEAVAVVAAVVERHAVPAPELQAFELDDYLYVDRDRLEG